MRKAPLLLAALLALSPTFPVLADQWTGEVVTLANSGGASLPMKVNDFLNTLGANTHFVQGADTAIAVENGIRYTGVRNIREDSTESPSTSSALVVIHAATGVMIDELPVTGDGANSIADTKAEYDALAAGGAMLAAEGPNEPNNFPFTYGGTQCNYSTTFGPCEGYQAALYAMVHSDSNLTGKAVWGMTEVGAEPDNVGLQWLQVPAGAPHNAGVQLADAANTHNYVRGNGSAGTTLIDNHAYDAECLDYCGPDGGDWDTVGEYWGSTWLAHFAAGPISQGIIPKVTTETNWYDGDGSITADQQGRLMTDLVADAALEGWSNTFIYDMFDSGYAMFNRNGNEADSGNATDLGKYIHNLTTILADTSSSFTPASPSGFSVTGETANDHHLLLERSDGKYFLLMWAEAFASETPSEPTINFGSSVAVQVWDITSGTAPVWSTTTSSVGDTLTDHLQIWEF